jgi:hypothetical protein
MAVVSQHEGDRPEPPKEIPVGSKRTRSVPAPPELLEAMTSAIEAEVAEHADAGPLDVPSFHRASEKAEQLTKLAWTLWEGTTAEDEAAETLRLKAGPNVDLLRIAEWNLRATGCVRENRDFYECWRLLRLASGRNPEPLPLENQRLAETLEGFLELRPSAQIAFLSSKVPRWTELFESVRADHRIGMAAEMAVGEAESAVRRLVGPRSASDDPLVRSYTARDVVARELDKVAAGRRATATSTRQRKRR